MSRSSVVAMAWAALLLVLAVVLWGVFVPHDVYSYVLPAAAVAGTAAIAVAARRRRPRPEGAEEVVAVSVPTSVASVGACVALVGLAVGPWMYLIGAGLTILGFVGLAREGV